MTPTEKRLSLWRTGSRVRRYHTMFTHMPDFVGHHSGGVAWLCWLAYGPEIRPELLMAALTHDLPEYATGDVPSPTKRLLGSALDNIEDRVYTEHATPNFNNILDDEEKEVLGYCDSADGLLYAVDEWWRGNSLMQPIIKKYHEYLCEVFGRKIRGAHWEQLHYAILAYYTTVITDERK